MVYKEATYHPSDKNRKILVDEWLQKSNACRISFPKLNRNIMAEFFKLIISFWATANVLVWQWLVLVRRQLLVVTFVMSLLIVKTTT